MKSTVENIYGSRTRIEKIPGSQKSALIVTNGGACHDCLTFVLDEAVNSGHSWYLLYIVDGEDKLGASAMRDIINSIKSNFGNNAKVIDDKRVYFISKSKFCREIAKFPVVLKSNQEWIPYEKIWNSMNEKDSVF